MNVPTVHLNGSSKEELLGQVLDAAHAVDAAIRKLADAAPNARDYYPQGAEVIISAQQEHRARIEQVSEVYRDLLSLYEQIDEQGTGGKR